LSKLKQKEKKRARETPLVWGVYNERLTAGRKEGYHGEKWKVAFSELMMIRSAREQKQGAHAAQ
jgi:hypothetical protein